MTSSHSGNGQSHDAGQNFFLVHLQSLTDFARELETQVGAILRPTQSVGGLATHPLALGDFVEGHALHTRHQAAAGEIHSVLESAQSAMEFAGDVTDVIASSYQRFDDHVADLYGGHATVTPPATSGYQPVVDTATGPPGGPPTNPPNPAADPAS